jgi:uncharacterized protein (DUF433 family)
MFFERDDTHGRVPPKTVFRLWHSLLRFGKRSIKDGAGAMGMPIHGRIVVNPDLMLGKPVIRGTRITVELILRKLGEGAAPVDLLEAYPHLTAEDIQAAMTYAADTLAHEDTLLVEPKA